MEHLPLNHRAKWTKTEQTQLLKETKMKIDINQIALNHKRTIGAIKFKLIRIAANLVDEHPSININKLIDITNLSKDDLLIGFNKIHLDFNINDNNNDSDSDNDSDNDNDSDCESIIIENNSIPCNNVISLNYVNEELYRINGKINCLIVSFTTFVITNLLVELINVYYR